jgi:phosphoglycerate dehydrogenase-like enzyme
MKDIRVLICCRRVPDEKILSIVRAVSARLVVEARGHDIEKDVSVWRDVEVLYTDNLLPPEGAAPNLRWIQGNYAGVDRWGLLPVTQPYIWTTTSGVHQHVAEFGLTIMFAFAHKLNLIFDNQKAAAWPSDRPDLFEPYELRGATVGIIGYGSIGRQLGFLCRSLGMRVLAADHEEVLAREPVWKLPGVPPVSASLPDRLYSPADFDDLLRQSDYVVLCVPYTPDTHHMIDARKLALMKPDAVLVNIARGGLVDEQALIDVLRAGKIRGAGLDVYSQEPLPASSPLWHLPNVIASPHVAGFSPNYLERAMTLFAENLRRYIVGEPLLNVVQKNRGY